MSTSTFWYDCEYEIRHFRANRRVVCIRHRTKVAVLWFLSTRFFRNLIEISWSKVLRDKKDMERFDPYSWYLNREFHFVLEIGP